MGVDYLHAPKMAVEGLEEERAGKGVGFDGGKLHARERDEGEDGEGVVSESADEGVEEEGVGVGDKVEGRDGGEGVAAERVGGDELGDDEGVAVEAKTEDLGVDLEEGDVIGAFMEV